MEESQFAIDRSCKRLGHSTPSTDALNPFDCLRSDVSELSVDLKGGPTHCFDLEALSASGPESVTYADVLRKLELSPHEVTVLVDGRPVPEDQPVDTDQMTVLRLIKGG